MESLFDYFFFVVWYNGYIDTIKEWIQYGDKVLKEKGDYVPCPLSGAGYAESTSYAYGQQQMLWMCLVQMYGDYGTSPRFGWITDWDECKRFLEAIVKKHEEYEHP